MSAGAPDRSTETTTLPNGLRVVSERMPGVRTAAVGVWVDGGARSESAERNGISHVLEHMAFKGTPRRSARDIAEQVEAAGAHMNAYTSREETAYHLRILPEDLPLAVDILADVLLRPLLREEDLALERDVIVQEIRESREQPDDVVFERFQAAAYPDQPIGRSVLGTPEGVRGFTGEGLRSHMEEHYRAGCMVLSAAGDVRHEELVALAGEMFADLPSGSPPTREPARYAGGTVRAPWKIEHVNLVLGFEGVPFGDPDFYALQVFAGALGGGMSSRLFQEVREKRGLAYEISAFSGGYRDSGMLGVHAGTGADDAGEVLEIVLRTLSEARERILPEEIARATAQARAGLLMGKESCAGRADSLARQLLVHGRPIGDDEHMRRIREVDEDALRRAAGRVLASRPTFAALGPDGGLPGEDAVGRLVEGLA